MNNENEIINSAVAQVGDNTVTPVEYQTIQHDNGGEKKGSKGVITIILGVLFVLTLACGVVGFVKNMGNPYEKSIDTIFKVLKNNRFTEDKVKTISTISINSKDTSVADLSKLSFRIETSDDLDNMKSLIKFALLKEGSEVFDVNALLDGNKIYGSSNKLFDKVVYYELGEDLKNSINKDDINYLIDKSEEAFKNAFKDEKLKSEKKDVTINGKSQSVKDNYYIVNTDNYSNIMYNYIHTYNDKRVKEILAKFNLFSETEIENLFSDLEEVKDEKEEMDETRISIYTKGIVNEVVGVNVSIKDKDYVTFLMDGDYSLVELKEDADNKFVAETKDKVTNLSLVMSKSTVLTGKITEVNDDKYNVELSIPDMVDIKIETVFEKLKKFEGIDTSSAVKFDDLKDSDLQKIEENLEKALKDAGIDMGGTSYGGGSVIDDTPTYTGDNPFEEELKDIYKTATGQWMMDNMSEPSREITYSSDGEHKLDSTFDSTYEITLNSAGAVISFKASNDEYTYDSGDNSNLKIEDIIGKSVKKEN